MTKTGRTPPVSPIYTRFLRTLRTLAGDMTGDEARAIRRGLRMSARQVAEELGTNESSIYRYEWRRAHEVPRMYAYALLHLLALRTRGSGQNNPPDEEEACV